MNSANRPATLAIVPVFRDDERMLTVLNNFDERVVDRICIVIDCPSRRVVERIRRIAIDTPVHTISNKTRKGIGYAIKQGLQYAMDNSFDIVVVLAGNNKDDPREIPRLLEPIMKEDYDYVQGSRFLQGGRSVRNPVLRGVFSRMYPFVWTLFTSVRCTDVTNGFRAYKVRILRDRRINLSQTWLDSYELEYYIHYKMLTLGYRIKEVPVSKIYQHRHKGGYSQISPFRDWWSIVGPLIYLKFGLRN